MEDDRDLREEVVTNAMIHVDADSRQNEEVYLNSKEDDIILEERNMEVDNTSTKRRREEDLEDESEWVPVGSRVTRSAKKRSLEEIRLSVTCREKLPKQFALAKLLKQHNITGVLRIKFANPYKFFINFRSEECAEKFIDCNEIKNLNWKCQKTWEVGISYGIIRDIDLELKEEELEKFISSTIDVVSIKRLNRRCENGWTPSESVRIGFLGPNLPAYIYLCDLRIKVDDYVFPVTQCGRCWRFGHVTKLCPSNKVICPKCTKFHANCETTHLKCVNCGGSHLPLAKICPVFIKEKKLRELMREFKVTYRKALSLYVPPTPQHNFETPKRVNTHNSFDGLDTSSKPAPSQPLFTSPIRTYAAAADTRMSRDSRQSTPAPAAPPPPPLPRTPLPTSGATKKSNARKIRPPIFVDKDEIGRAGQIPTYTNESDCEQNSDSDFSDRGRWKDRKKKLISLKELIERLKDLFLLEKLNILTKFKVGFEIIRDWVIMFVYERINDWPIVKLLTSLW
ncbi:hypothetical protein O0L34_g17209 [Tuta absoluta]|nr:hypothetical protein O0L34_g17209 [Tuta absoluta]